MLDVNEFDFVKYRKCIYLTKSLIRLENGKYRLSYFFKSIKKNSGILYKNNFEDKYEFHATYITKATKEEADFLTARIKNNDPSFDLSFTSIKSNSRLNENDCIKHLKEKGYLVYKPV